MKRLFLILTYIFLVQTSFAQENDYIKTYQELQPATHSYVHDIDPDHDYESKNTTWSPYPLFRLNSPLYFKHITIEPGYYLLTPREYKGDWFILFKQNGRIKYIIPCYNRDITPELFYDENLPKPKLTFTQHVHIKMLNWIGRFVPSSKRRPAPNTYLEATDLDGNFVSLIIYYGSFRYYTIFRTVKF